MSKHVTTKGVNVPIFVNIVGFSPGFKKTGPIVLALLKFNYNLSRKIAYLLEFWKVSTNAMQWIHIFWVLKALNI